MGKKILVVSAHPGDLLWRCSGTVAKHTAAGDDVKILILTYGTGGEANEVMSQPGMTVEKAKEMRTRDTTRAAEILGASSIEFWDMQDYPFAPTREDILRLAKTYREYQPSYILTHHPKDPLNPDHGAILQFVMMAAEAAGGKGILIEGTEPGLAQRRTPIFCFEPHTSEYDGFNPNVFVDITDVIEVKKQAMACFVGKEKLAQKYLYRAMVRADNATSFGRVGCQYAEAYEAVYPFALTGDFVF